MISTKFDGARRVVLAALENNHRGYCQIRHYLKNDSNGRCATGLAAEALHIPIKRYNDLDVYRSVEELLGDKGVTDIIVQMNDSRSYSFFSIAKELAVRWGL